MSGRGDKGDRQRFEVSIAGQTAGYTSEHLNYIPYTCVIRTGILFYTLEMYNVEHYLLQVLHL